MIFLGCGQAFYMMYGAYLHDFSRFSSSLFTLFRAILGDFDTDALYRVDPVFSRPLFLLFTVLA